MEVLRRPDSVSRILLSVTSLQASGINPPFPCPRWVCHKRDTTLDTSDALRYTVFDLYDRRSETDRQSFSSSSPTWSRVSSTRLFLRYGVTRWRQQTVANRNGRVAGKRSLQAARAVFAQDGLRRATVDAVAHRAEVGKGTIYLYFESKEAILAELVLQALGELAAQLQAASDRCSVLHPDHRLAAMADAYLAFAQHAPDYFRLLNAFDHGDFQDGISPELREQILHREQAYPRPGRQAIADGMALGLFAPGDAHQAPACCGPRSTARSRWSRIPSAAPWWLPTARIYTAQPWSCVCADWSDVKRDAWNGRREA